jgi:hypothetical protein
MKGEEEVAYCRRQAERCRRLARGLRYQRRDVARALEGLAEEFDRKAALLEEQTEKVDTHDRGSAS